MLIGSSCSVRKIATPQVYRAQFMTTKIFFRNKALLLNAGQFDLVRSWPAQYSLEEGCLILRNIFLIATYRTRYTLSVDIECP